MTSEPRTHNGRATTRRDTGDLAGLRVGLYCRVSLDKSGDAKSTTDQLGIGREWAQRVGARIAGEYIEPGSRSASRFATKAREEFKRLVADVEAGQLDAIWFWEQSRSARRLDVFAKLRDLCRRMGVLWVERDRIIDPNDSRDMLTAGFKALIDEQGSEDTSERVLRGKASSAAAGRPPGRIPYGYRREYDPHTKAYVRDVPDVFDDNGRATEDSPAWVVREIFTRLAAGESRLAIARGLNDRGVSTRYGGEWRPGQINYVAQNPTYIAKRFHQAGEWVACPDGKERLRGYAADRRNRIIDDAEVSWPPLVDDETFWAVQQMYIRGSEKPKRPTRARHLLSSIARCGKCGGVLVGHNARGHQSGPVYQCLARSCVGIYERDLDRYVEERVVRWLSRADVAADLTRVDESAEAARARADADQQRAALAEWRRSAEAGEVTPATMARAEKGCLARIAQAEKRIHAATRHPILTGNVGPQAAAGWQLLDFQVKRQIIQMVADIRVRPVGRGHPGKTRTNKGQFTSDRAVMTRERVEWRWLIGPDVGGE